MCFYLWLVDYDKLILNILVYMIIMCGENNKKQLKGSYKV